MRRFLILFLFGCCIREAGAQRLDARDYVYPVRSVARLYSANFGEIRAGHFHSGVDIKTDGITGREAVATADGYVSRVTISAGGFGRALYITLRDGKTAVYGHLDRFRKDIEEHVRAERYRRTANALDLEFTPGQWPVKQGETVAYTGNSGSSLGPHLHYELRDTPTQRYLNIVREGVIRPVDNLPPRILRIHYIEVDSLRGVCMQAQPVGYSAVRSSQGRYRLTRSEPVSVGPLGYFVAEVTDRRNNVDNTFGIWRLTAWIDGQRYFEFRMDGFTPAQSRYSNAVSYFPLQTASRNEAIRLARLDRTPEFFYTAMEEHGVIRSTEGQLRRMRIEAEDDRGNISQLEFDIRGRARQFLAEADTAALLVGCDRLTVVRHGSEMTAQIPAGALYEPIFCRPVREEVPDAAPGIAVLSPAYRIFDSPTPLHSNITVSIRSSIPPRLQLRTTLAGVSPHGKLTYVGGTYENGAVRASTRETNPLVIVADTLPPGIRPIFTQGADLSRHASLCFRANDNFSGVGSYALTIDGQWVPCDRFPMQGTLVHSFDKPASGRRHDVRLTVSDNSGNSSEWNGTFYR